jgi:hypothetical protein
MSIHLAQARETNRLWLESRGCAVRNVGFGVLVRHPQFAEFNAIYDLADPAKVDEALELADREFPPGSQSPTIFLPLDAKFDEARWRMQEADLRPVFRSETLAAQLARGRVFPASPFRLRPVTEQTMDRWLQIYMENYGIGGPRAAAERQQWLHVFSSAENIQFCLVENYGVPVGTAQFVMGPGGWCGVYALSIARARRGLESLKFLMQQVLESAAQAGASWVFFDRLRPVSRATIRSQSIRRDLQWRGFEWRVLSAEIGFRR